MIFGNRFNARICRFNGSARSTKDIQLPTRVKASKPSPRLAADLPGEGLAGAPCLTCPAAGNRRPKGRRGLNPLRARLPQPRQRDTNILIPLQRLLDQPVEQRVVE